MNRLFADHEIRRVFSLDGIWDFKKDEGHVGEAERWYENFPTEDIMQVAVPSCVNNRLGMISYQDLCWYKKTFYVEKGAILIHFGSVSEYAKVYLDGTYLGDHYGGFTAFEFVKEVEAGEHTLVVMVDPRSTEDTIPLWEVDWHHYCGIMRSVEISQLPERYIAGVTATYELSEDLQDALLRVETVLAKSGNSDGNGTMKVWLDDTLIGQSVYDAESDPIVSVEYRVEQVRLWDMGKPELYRLRVEIAGDDWIDRIGFRKIEVQGKQILLNGKAIVIKGVNRHEEHPDWGFSVPLSIMQRDMDILKDLNVNTIRGSHYPNSKYFLDLCDAEGILFWSEIPMWGFKEHSLQRPLVIERGLRMHEEMIAQYRHHPSIVFWGMHNEVATETQAGYEITKKFSEKVRSLDNSRLITFATDRVTKDICLEFADVISVNKYVGWYGGDTWEWGDFVTEMKAYLKEQNVFDKPIIMSEFGVGAIFGHKNFEELRWSENYQQDFYDHTIRMFLGDQDMSGVLLWQFCDIRSNAKWSLLRARSFNNKGLLNEYRHPKLAYYKVKELFGYEWNKGNRS